MKTAVIYYSAHHGNTKKVLDAIARRFHITLIDAVKTDTADLAGYDLIGFASGIYYSQFHETVINYAAQYLPAGKEVFFLCTHGSRNCPEKYFSAITAAAKEKNCRILGRFSCRGYDTYGPFKLIGGLAKGHPDETDLQKAREFIQNL